MEAAELEFAGRGFTGAGMKALATLAGVSQSLLHYRFGSKDKLHAAVTRNRSSMIDAIRLTLLRAVDKSAEDGLAQVYQSALGLMAMALPRDGREARLAGRPETEHDEEDYVETLIRFAVGGAKAVQSG